MDSKLNNSELNALFAKVCGLSPSDAEAFTKAFYDTILEGLETEEMVKINGLGTFKVIDVESRSSVDVNTGERIEIKGHKKLTFIPADSLKETINEPFAMFQPVEVDDALVDDEEESASFDDNMEEPVASDDNVEDPGVVVAEIAEEIPVEVISDEPVVASTLNIDEEMPLEIVAEVVSPMKNVSTEKSLESVVAEPADAINIVENESSVPVIEQKLSVEIPEKGEQPVYDNSRGFSLKKIFTQSVFVIFLLLVVGFAAFYFFSNYFSLPEQNNVAEPINNRPLQKVKNSESHSSLSMAVQDTNFVDSTAVASQNVGAETQVVDTVAPFVMVEALANRKLSEISLADTLDYAFAGTKCEHSVALEETLTKIALLHFGDKKMWPYIVKYNNMSRPNDLACGMIIEIPHLVPRK